MTAPIVAHQAELTAPGRRLVVPHVQIGAERIRQHQHRSVLRPLDFHMNDATVVGFDIRHRPILPIWRSGDVPTTLFSRRARR